jgi:hypothetical protein
MDSPISEFTKGKIMINLSAVAQGRQKLLTRFADFNFNLGDDVKSLLKELRGDVFVVDTVAATERIRCHGEGGQAQNRRALVDAKKIYLKSRGLSNTTSPDVLHIPPPQEKTTCSYPF